MSSGNRRTNHRAPLRLSTLAPTDFTLPGRTGEPATIICPTCHTWRRIQRRMITTHRAQPRDNEGQRLPKCGGSGQLVDFDVDPARWHAWLAARTRRMAAGMDPAARHATTLIKRPAPAPRSPGHTDLAPAEAARRIHRDHLARCTTCTSTSRCPAGTRLEREALRLLASPADRRTTEWGRVLPAVRRADAARTTTPTR